jgi:hypothetical protein
MDSFSRTGKPAIFAELRFNVPYAIVDSESNIALGKAITDSEASSAEQLNALVDGDATKLIDLPNKVGDWIEIDLGKDQTVSEIQLLGKDPSFWNKFDIMTYFTGETINQASPFAHEVDFSWNLQTRPEQAGTDVTGLVYRGVGKGVRYIRLICRTPGASAKLGEIKVFGTKSQ